MLTQKELKKVLSYNPDTGMWVWKKTGYGISKNMIAGTVNDGYHKIRINGKLYKASRLAWLYMTGSWPKHFIDHVDRNTENDQWSNLREATSNQNMYNTKIFKNNKSGVKGVCWNKVKQMWHASIGYDNKRVFLGLHASISAAAAARKAAEIKYHKEFRAKA